MKGATVAILLANGLFTALAADLGRDARAETSVDVGLISSGIGSGASEALAQWGKMVGLWTVEYEFTAADGTVGTGNGEWNWFYILGGSAIQDVWINPGRGAEAGPRGRVFGTNLRIFNPELGKWQVVWTNNRSKKMEYYEAVSNDEEIVMRPLDDPNRARITFYNITASHFDWLEEVSDDGGKTWRKSQVIRGTRQ